MRQTFSLTVAGVTRDLPLCPVNDKLDIAAFIMFGDVELTVACASELLKKVPEFDVILTAEAKGIPLAYEMSRQSGKLYIPARKGPKLYMEEPVVVEDRSITTCLLYTSSGVMLTLDASVQRVCEAVAREMMEKGSIVVMETSTGRILASVSMPEYDPDDPSASIDAQDSPFLNRSISAYNVGSVFKPLLAAAAIEQGIPAETTYHCTGSITVAGHTYRLSLIHI